MQLKKFFASLFAALLVFSCSFPLSSRAYADDILFQLYSYDDSHDPISFDSVSLGYTPSFEFKRSPWSATVFGLSNLNFLTSEFDTSLLAGRTFYCAWFVEYSPTTNTVSLDVSGYNRSYFTVSYSNSNSSYTAPFVSMPTSSWSTYYYPNIYGNQYSSSPTYLTNGVMIGITIPTTARMLKWSFNGYVRTGSGNCQINAIVYPVMYIAEWGDEIRDSLSSILQELLDQGRSLDSILSVLNSIYTEASKISSDTAAIRSLMVTCANKLTSADSHLANIENTVDDIYYLLYEALSDESDDLSDEAADLGDNISQRIDSEQYWNDKNSSNYNAIGLDNFTFSSGILSGLQLVGTIFSNIWNSLGDATIPIIFSLTFGIALVVIGRIGRSSGGGKSSKKDDK